MKTWKYRRRPSGRTTDRDKDDRDILSHHHLDQPGKYKARAMKNSVRQSRPNVYQPGKVDIFSFYSPSRDKWVKSPHWVLKPKHQNHA